MAADAQDGGFRRAADLVRRVALVLAGILVNLEVSDVQFGGVPCIDDEEATGVVS